MLTYEQLVAQLHGAELRRFRDTRPHRCDNFEFCGSDQGYTMLDPTDAELREVARVVCLCARCADLAQGDV